MKTSNTCPKCHSRRVLKNEGKSGSHYRINYGRWGSGSEKVNRYICLKCGYMEQYAVLSEKFVRWANGKLPKDWEEDNDFV